MSEIGPTGKYPQGKVDASDKGELCVGLSTDHEHGVIVLRFGVRVDWAAINPEMARALAVELLRRADDIEQSGRFRIRPS